VTRALAIATWLVAAACSKSDSPTKPAPAQDRPPPMSEAELTRANDACTDYLARVCKCGETVDAAKNICADSQALPAALKMSVDLATATDAEKLDVLRAQTSIRRISKTCIDGAAQLPALGCQ